MKPVLLVLYLSVLEAQGVLAQGFQGFADHRGQPGSQNSGLLFWPNETYLEPIRPNACGPWIHTDSTGRPFQRWAPDARGHVALDLTLRVTPNHYGLGVHADQY